MLSAKELELVNNAEVILTKNIIIQKTKLLLEELQEEMLAYLKKDNKSLPEEVITIPPKISKGENYKGLPYLILDYPRYFNKENVFAVRTMFWWGNFFSSTLHLSKQYKSAYSEKIKNSYSILKAEKYYICIQENEWEHHFERNNFIPVQDVSASSFTQKIEDSPFIKLAYNLPVNQWENATEVLMNCFVFYNNLLSDQLPRR